MTPIRARSLPSDRPLWEAPSFPSESPPPVSPSLPGGYWTAEQKFPACTFAQALTHFLDVTTPPSQQMLRRFSQVAREEADKARLGLLGQVSWAEQRGLCGTPVCIG